MLRQSHGLLSAFATLKVSAKCWSTAEQCRSIDAYKRPPDVAYICARDNSLRTRRCGLFADPNVGSNWSPSLCKLIKSFITYLQYALVPCLLTQRVTSLNLPSLPISYSTHRPTPFLPGTKTVPGFMT